jgi:DNA-binding GntR family transcriptional regulator
MAVNKSTFKDYAMSHIFNGMIDGTYRPGDQLNESILAGELEISRAPIREALRELVGSGLVEYRPRVGHFIAIMSKQEVIDTYIARGILEGAAAAQSMDQLTKEDIVALEIMPSKMEELSRKGMLKPLIELGNKFHELLFEKYKNTQIVTFTKQLSLKSDLLFYEYIGTLYTPGEIKERHMAIVDCIKLGDSGQLEKLIRAHYTESGRKIAALIN